MAATFRGPRGPITLNKESLSKSNLDELKLIQSAIEDEIQAYSYRSIRSIHNIEKLSDLTNYCQLLIEVKEKIAEKEIEKIISGD